MRPVQQQPGAAVAQAAALIFQHRATRERRWPHILDPVWWPEAPASTRRNPYPRRQHRRARSGDEAVAKPTPRARLLANRID